MTGSDHQILARLRTANAGGEDPAAAAARALGRLAAEHSAPGPSDHPDRTMTSEPPTEMLRRICGDHPA
jgi:hypothetical protein